MKTCGLSFTGDLIPALMTCAQCGTLSPGACPECGSVEKLKTMTRRVMNPQPPRDWSFPYPARFDGVYLNRYGCARATDSIKAPYQPGDIVYAKEAWGTLLWHDHMPPRDLPDNASIAYEVGCAWRALGRYRHARFLPERLARIWREVVEVRAERVQAISEEDARAELGWWSDNPTSPGFWRQPYTPQVGFRIRWNGLHAKRHGGIYVWEKNPLVWVYRLKVSAREAAEEKR